MTVQPVPPAFFLLPHYDFLREVFLEVAFFFEVFLAGAFLEAAFLAEVFLEAAFFLEVFLADAFLEAAFLAEAFFTGGVEV